MDWLQHVAQRPGHIVPGTASSGPWPLGPRHGGPSARLARLQRSRAARVARMRNGDAGSGCTDSKDRWPTARCWLDDNGTRKNVVRPSPVLKSGVDGGSTRGSSADSGTSASASSAHGKEQKWGEASSITAWWTWQASSNSLTEEKEEEAPSSTVSMATGASGTAMGRVPSLRSGRPAGKRRWVWQSARREDGSVASSYLWGWRQRGKGERRHWRVLFSWAEAITVTRGGRRPMASDRRAPSGGDSHWHVGLLLFHFQSK
jgi:hypothetical protein